MSSIPVFDISNPLGGLLDQAVAMGYVNEKRTATKGAIASFDDNIEHAVSLEIDIAPTLDGVSAVNVVSCGKNLFNPSTVFTATGSYMYAKSIFPQNTNLICKFVDKDPTVDISGIYFGFYDDTYTSGSASSGHFRWLINNGNVQTNMSNTASSDVSVLCNSLFAFPKDQNTLDILLDRFDIQIEVGTTSTDYVEYDGTTSTISLGSTVYGGSVSVSEEGEVSIEDTGLLIDNWDAATLQSVNAFGIANFQLINRGRKVTGYKINSQNMSWQTSLIANEQNEGIMFTNETTIFVRLKAEDYPTIEDFKTWANTNLQIVFEKDTPTTSELDPIAPIETLVGENNIWADTGDIEVGYYYQLYQPI